MWAWTSLKAACPSGSRFLRSPGSPAQKARLTVMESPKRAKVPFLPPKRAWTLRMAGTQSGPARSGAAAWSGGGSRTSRARPASRQRMRHLRERSWGHCRRAGEGRPPCRPPGPGNAPPTGFCLTAGRGGMKWDGVRKVNPDRKESPLPIHPALVKFKQASVEMDQPCCLFEPPVLAIREGQSWVVKNSAKIPHHANILGGKEGPNVNPLIPPGKSVEIPAKELTARPNPISVSCSIHGWMRAYARVFNHPYFAVTDADGQFEIKNAPAGNFRLVAWHPGVGWVTGEGTEPDRNGMPINIRAGGVTNLGKID